MMEACIMMIGHKIIVVGGTSGIGLAVARNAADCGADVYIGSRNPEKLKSVLSTLQGVRGAVLDVGNEESVSRFFSNLSEIDHIVSTVGQTYRPTPFADMQLEEAEALYKIKYWGQFLIAKHGGPKLQENGSLTLTSGILSTHPVAGMGVLASINAGIEALGRTLALELAPRRVNTVCPGFIDTEKLWKDLPAEEREAKLQAKAASDLLVARAGHPDDAAKSYLYAIQNPYVTGQTLVVDGGASLT
jgi:NAD(P)-dependent dehydrogenase (short-subunit alcohol dehydrogenase family)